MSLFLLMVAFVLTGLLNISNKALVEWNLSQYRDLYVLAYYGTPLLIGTIVLLVRGQRGDAMDMRVGLLMGFGGALALTCFLLALQGMPGIVAFPVRNLGNLVCTATVSIIAWRDQLSRSQRIGIGLSLLAIWLIY
jgi:multidrug transporter EmrE-like cation transporter